MPALAGTKSERSASQDVDVIVVGAGMAGLAAAAALRAAGVSVIVLEAGRRAGGRAWTDRPAALAGAVFDHGAQWLHEAASNPLVPLAHSCGEAVVPDKDFADRLSIGGDPGSKAAYEAATAAWHDAVTRHLGGADMSLAEAARDVAGEPWTATIEAWEGSIIAAADAEVLSLHDWSANELNGANFVAPGGLGALLTRMLAPPAGQGRFGAAVTAVAREAGAIKVTTGIGELRAAAVIVTVSTGVLRSGRIGFSPGLPQEIVAALDGLPMGLLSKVALPARGGDRLDLTPDSELFDRVPHRGAAFMPIMVWPDDHDFAVGFIGGNAAWDFASAPDDAACMLRDELVRLVGGKAKLVFGGRQAVTTDWGTNPLFLGAYAYARPGCFECRRALGLPQWDGKLLFAGEACAYNGKAGTVAGAYESGSSAAAMLLRGFPHPTRQV